MAWQTPKLDWAPEDGVLDADFNRIEGNIQDLHDRSSELSPNVLTKDLVLYVTTSGNDETGDGSASTPYKTIGKALSVVPRNLSGHSVMISIGAGTYTERVEISGFDAPITITGGIGALVTVTGFRVSGVSCELSNITLSVKSGVFVTNGGKLLGEGALELQWASLTVNYGGVLSLARVAVDNATGFAIEVNRMGRFFANQVTGIGNTSGIRCQHGGVAAFGSNNLEVSSTRYMTASGGRIYSDSQDTIPEF